MDYKNFDYRKYVTEHLDEAFEKRYFVPYYQPVIRSITGEVCGYEALARWVDPDHGVIPPGIFIDVLEKEHRIHELDAYIVEQVCSDLRDDFDSGFAYQPISVNLSRMDFEACDIKSIVDAAREKYRIPVDYLVIEITESAIASDRARIGEKIQEFRSDGYQVWMDDFGSGYSSFNNLQMYDFDELKIDMNFLRDFDTNEKSKVIIATIVNMAKILGIHTLTEGVETKEQYEFLRKIGCEMVQGFYFGRPKPVEEFTRQIDCSFETNEDPEFKTYYDTIGKLNFLSSIPLRPITRQVYNNLPIVIIEEEDDKDNVNFLFGNEAFLKLSASMNIDPEKDLVDFRTSRILSCDKEYFDGMTFHDVIKLAEKSGTERITFEYMLNGEILSSRTRFIVRQGKKAAFAFVTRKKI